MVKLFNNLITPFNEEGEVCFDTLKLLIKDCEDNKNDGLIVAKEPNFDATLRW